MLWTRQWVERLYLQVAVADVCEPHWRDFDNLQLVEYAFRGPIIIHKAHQEVEQPADGGREATNGGSQLHWSDFACIQEWDANEAFREIERQ